MKPLRTDNITLSLAWRNLWRHPRRTWLTVGAMVFSNILLVFMISLQLGMYRLMYENSLSLITGHLQVQAEGYIDEPRMRLTVPAAADLASKLREAMPLNTVAARATAFALVSSAERSFGVQVVGVQPAHEAGVSNLPGLVSRGRYFEEQDGQVAVIGSALARNLKVDLGDELTLFGSGRDGSFAAGIATVVGIFESESTDIDRSFIQIPLGEFQEIFVMEDHAHSIVVMTPDLFELGPAAAKMASFVDAGGLVVHDWDRLLPGLRQSVQADMASAWFMYAVLIVLVAFSVLNTQLMSVLDRTREFGIVMALGLSPFRLGRLVLLETCIMAGLGLLLGVAAGSAIVSWFGFYGFTYPGLEEMAARFNLPGRIYPSASFASVMWGPSVVFLACLAAAIYPAAKLLRLQPVAAMRAV
jgi:ABC-type lipoprotein release transport system permease subunit